MQVGYGNASCPLKQTTLSLTQNHIMFPVPCHIVTLWLLLVPSRAGASVRENSYVRMKVCPEHVILNNIRPWQTLPKNSMPAYFLHKFNSQNKANIVFSSETMQKLQLINSESFNSTLCYHAVVY